MNEADAAAGDAFAHAQRTVLQCLRVFEAVQQDIRFDAIDAAQRRLGEACGEDALERAGAALAAPANAPAAALARAVELLRRAAAVFVGSRGWPEFGAAFVASRAAQCEALEVLYRQRAGLPHLAPYFDLDGVPPHAAERCGLEHHQACAAHHAYTLYVPEYYDPARRWPLIVCLHGGYGRGDDYVWTWLRAARSRGYVLLSPKSIGPTWSIVQPALDTRSILAMLDRVCASHAIDSARIFLTGLSDGGTFSYLLGLGHSARFAALAPVAASLSPATDPLLRAGAGKALPLHVVHGVHDTIFPVRSVRSTNALLIRLGYALEYTELPDWGHALTQRINETLLLPWFAAIGGR